MYHIIDKAKRVVPGSNKPYSKTTVDAIITMVISVGVTFILLMLWTGSEGIGLALAQTAVIAFILQFVYEYLGVNTMIYESSARYMRGATLDKFASVTLAKCYLEYNKLRSVLDTSRLAELESNMDVLEVILKPKIIKELLLEFPVKPDQMTGKEYDDIMNACGKDKEKCKIIGKLVDILDDYTIRWLLLNGFAVLDRDQIKLASQQDGIKYLESELLEPDEYIIENYGSRAKLEKKLELLRHGI